MILLYDVQNNLNIRSKEFCVPNNPFCFLDNHLFFLVAISTVLVVCLSLLLTLCI